MYGPDAFGFVERATFRTDSQFSNLLNPERGIVRRYDRWGQNELAANDLRAHFRSHIADH